MSIFECSIDEHNDISALIATAVALPGAPQLRAQLTVIEERVRGRYGEREKLRQQVLSEKAKKP